VSQHVLNGRLAFLLLTELIDPGEVVPVQALEFADKRALPRADQPADDRQVHRNGRNLKRHDFFLLTGIFPRRT
jgi:hypothetical protein